MLDLSFHNIIHSNLINFVIMAAIIVWLCVKLNVSEKLDSLRINTEKKVKNSDNEKNEASRFLNDTKKSVENLGQELEEIKQNAQVSANNLANKILEDAHSQIDRLESNAQKNIENEVSKVQEELKKEICESTLKTAKEQIEQRLNADINLHKKLIEESINALDRIEI